MSCYRRDVLDQVYVIMGVAQLIIEKEEGKNLKVIH